MIKSKSSWRIALALVLAGIPVMGEDQRTSKFVGSLSFEVKHGSVSMPLRYYSDGKHVRIELGKEGQPSRIWLSGLDEMAGVVAISPLKMSYTLEQDRPIRRGSPRGESPSEAHDRSGPKPGQVVLPEPEITDLSGLPCRRYLLKTDGPDTEVWVLENALPIPVVVLSMWSGLREALPQVSQSCMETNGLPLQVFRKNWRGKQQFSITLVDSDLQVPVASLFAIPQDYFRTKPTGRMGTVGGRPGGSGRPGSGRKGP